MDIKDIVNFKEGFDLLKIVYEDSTQPAVKKVGEALGTVLDLSNTILLPIKLLNEKSKLVFSNNMERYKSNLEYSKVEKLVQVPPEIGIPILEKLTYVTNEEISQLYINLLSSASTSETNHTAHPGFIKIIESLSPDEAKIIRYLYFSCNEKKSEHIKYITFRVKKNSDSSYTNLYQRLTGIEKKCKLNSPNNIKVYLDNLIGLGLIEDHDNAWLIETYDDLTEIYSDIFNNLNQTLQGDGSSTIYIHKSYLSITNFGLLFLNACMFDFIYFIESTHQCIELKQYESAIDQIETFIKDNDLYPNSIRLEILELYLLTNRLSNYIETYNQYNLLLNEDKEICCKNYLNIVYHFLNKDDDSFIHEIKEFLKLDNPVIKKIAWSFNEIKNFLNLHPETRQKKLLSEFIDYIKSEKDIENLRIAITEFETNPN